MTQRVINFSPGPATLPLEVLEEIKSEFTNIADSGMSIMEHSHRGAVYSEVHDTAVALTRELLNVPDDYEVLFMQGGASGQFAIVPMNLLGSGQSADYITTGAWSEKALAEGEIIGTIREAANTKQNDKYIRVPNADELTLDKNAAYVHLTSNNTIAGTQFHEFPNTGDVPTIADMSVA